MYASQEIKLNEKKNNHEEKSLKFCVIENKRIAWRIIVSALYLIWQSIIEILCNILYNKFVVSHIIYTYLYVKVNDYI